MTEMPETIQARVTSSQKQAIARIAERDGLTVSSWVRMVVLRAARKGDET